MIITVKNVYSQLSESSAEMERLLSVPYPNYWFSPRFKAGLWDGFHHFLTPANKFPTGLLFMLEEFFQQRGIEYQVIDRRLKPPTSLGENWLSDPDIESKILAGISLRDYQLEAIARSIHMERGVYELPTGSGKTEIAAGIIKTRGLYPVLFVVHTQDLLWQTVERFKKRLGCDIGYIGDGVKKLDSGIVVATVQSLDAWLKKDEVRATAFFYSIQVLFQDECHHASANTWFKIGQKAINAYYRYGLSGTILRRDVLSNMKLLSIFGAPIMRMGAIDLIEKGYLSKIDVMMIDNPEVVRGYSWQDIYNAGVVRSEARNHMVMEKAVKGFRENKRVMILVRQIEHGQILSQMLQNEGIPVAFLWGATKKNERQDTKTLFNDDGGFVMIASPIFDEGVDLPEINVLIIAAGGKSEVKTIQRVGRGLRNKSDKSGLQIYDFADGSRFLKEHSKRRLDVYRKEEFISTEGGPHV